VQRSLLAARAAAPEDAATYVSSQLARDGFVSIKTIAAAWPGANPQLDDAGESLARAGRICRFGDVVVDMAAFGELRKHTAAAIEAHHAAHPEDRGLPLVQVTPLVEAHVRRRRARVATAALQEALVASLVAEAYAQASGYVFRRSHSPALPPRLRAAGEAIRRALGESPFDPPSRASLCASDAAHQAMKFLIASGEVVELNHDVVMLRSAYTEAGVRVRSKLASIESATVSELKTFLASSRRVMVPLLEKLDRAGITRRVGDRRYLAGARSVAPDNASVGR
jgi:selenocysteine-specific elongation factor